MSVTKRGNSWMVSVSNNGRRIRRMFPDLSKAQRFEQRVRLDFADGLDPSEHVSPKGNRGGIPITFGKMADHVWKMEWSSQKAADHTYNRMMQVIEYFGEDKLLVDITTYDLEQYILHLESLGNAPATVNRKMAVVSKVLNYAERHDVIPRAPKVSKKREPKGRIRYYTPEEEASILKAMGNPDLKDLFIVLLDTGMRRGEALGLEPEDVDFDRNQIVLGDPSKTKSSMTRTIPMTQRVRAIMRKRQGATVTAFSFTPHWLEHEIAKFKQYSGYTGPTEAMLHTCRHTFVSRLVQKGVPITMVKELAGHSSIQTTMRYAHLGPSNLTDAIEALEDIGG